MKKNRWIGWALLLVLVTSSPLVPNARAEDWSDPAEAERWWGVAGAVICGAEMNLIRTSPVLGMNPYALAAGISGCLLAALDAAT